MINGKLKYFFIFLFTFSLYNAQVKIHKSLTTEDGIGSNRIFCIFEDSKGYMWFGTNNGVSRWDGINFKNFYTLNGLGGSQVFDIKEGPDGKIYFATYGKGITVYNNDSLYILNKDNGLLSNWVTKILVRLNGDIIFAAENGLISGIRNNKIVNIKEELGFGNNNIWSLFESKDSTLYLGSFKLFRYRNKKLNEFSHEDSYAPSASFQTIYAIGEDHANNLFIGTLNGIHKFENEKLHKLKINGQPYSNSAVSIITALDGTMYFCGDNGVLVKDENHFDLLGKNDGLTDNNIWSAFEDSNGIIYFGTRDQGINIYYPNKLETYLNDKLNNISITAISQDTMNNLYFGTTNGLLLNNKQSIVRKLNKRTINTISLGNQNQIYVGTNEGFHILQNGSFKNFNLVPNPSALNKVWTINYSKTNKLLIGFQGGLYYFADNKLEKLSSLKGHNQFIQDVISIHDSTIVVGTHGRGLNFYKNGKETNFSLENGLTDNIINCLHETSYSLLLVGTDQGGLNILQNQFLLRTITLNDGLTSNTIFDINEDKNGNIYLSTSKGLNILDNLLDTLSIRTILSNDGLVSNSCNLNATYIDKIGNIWIGTNNGVTKYNPNADKPVTNPPKIYLTGLEIFNEPYPIKLLSTENELNYDQNYLKFIYTGINLSAPEKILYKYRLSGVDQNWVESMNNNVQYTSLDNGNYTFEVKARNEWGYWSEPTNISFTINPAWWETWWFRLLFISFISGLLWLAFQYRLNYLLKLERLRTKIASDLHDEVGSLLTQISVNADSLSYIQDSDKIKEKSGFIRAKSSEVINMMSDVIWSIDSRNDNLDSLIDRIHNFAQKFLEQNNISLSFSTNIKNLQKPLKIDFRQNVMLIAKEAINNAVKYSNCSQIDVLINYNNEIFEMNIADNGKGFDLENVNKGNGLKNMKMRSDAIGAKIEFKNKNGFSIKLTKAKL